MKSSEEKKINCKWLNTRFGEGYYICNGFLKPVNWDICKSCKERIKLNNKEVPYVSND
jgi:hypothetical protein